MAARPLDYGDPFPSDSGDQLPANPSAEFGESNFTIKQADTGRSAKPRGDSKLFPDQRVQENIKEGRSAFHGTLLKRLTKEGVYPAEFNVLRQDGRFGIAQASGAEGVYDEYRIGDSVTLMQGQAANNWLIIGSPRPKEIPLLEVKLTDGFISDLEKVIPFDEEVTNVGNFNDEIILGVDGAIQVSTEDNALYDISWMVSVQFEDLDQITGDGASLVNLKTACHGVTASLGNVTGNSIVFDSEPGFRVGRDGCHATVSLFGPSSFHWLFQDAGGGAAKWSGQPKLAGSPVFGVKLEHAWVKVEPQGGNKLWLGPGDGANQKIRFPSSAAKHNAFLGVEGVSGECVQLGWLEMGGEGTIKAYDCNYKCVEWVIKRGVIVSGPGITKPQSSARATCPDPKVKDVTC
jgi:hypothetical protein